MVAPHISTKYKKRNETIYDVKELIEGVISSKIGNYFVYVPSYEYLNNLIPLLEDLDIELLVQEKDMTNEEKEQFISIFQSNPARSRVGIAVIGGAFSEGIDLLDDRLIGVIVVGVGLPQLCFERDLIRNYFDNLDPELKEGYNYAYLYPGFNKVMQAVGRVIRSENDRGIALLIDDRYLNKNYRELYKDEWSHYQVVNSKEDIMELMDEFYLKEKN